MKSVTKPPAVSMVTVTKLLASSQFANNPAQLRMPHHTAAAITTSTMRLKVVPAAGAAGSQYQQQVRLEVSTTSTVRLEAAI